MLFQDRWRFFWNPISQRFFLSKICTTCKQRLLSTDEKLVDGADMFSLFVFPIAPIWNRLSCISIMTLHLLCSERPSSGVVLAVYAARGRIKCNIGCMFSCYRFFFAFLYAWILNVLVLSKNYCSFSTRSHGSELTSAEFKQTSPFDTASAKVGISFEIGLFAFPG